MVYGVTDEWGSLQLPLLCRGASSFGGSLEDPQDDLLDWLLPPCARAWSTRVSPVSMQASGQGHDTWPQKATEDPGRARSPGVHSGKDDFENYSG